MGDSKNSLYTDGHRLSAHEGDNSHCRDEDVKDKTKRKPYVKKPFNAFMLFMKEMRPKVISECTLRESSAINQILGRKRQSKYYEMARKEKDLHRQLYPGWTARDNYAAQSEEEMEKGACDTTRE